MNLCTQQYKFCLVQVWTYSHVSDMLPRLHSENFMPAAEREMCVLKKT